MTRQHLPPGWATAKIEDLFATLHDGRTMHQGWSPQCEDGPAGPDEWGVLKTTAIQAGWFLDQHNKRLPTELEPRPGIEVAVGDILLTCAGPRSRCGVPCLVRHTRPKLMMSGKMYRFRVPEDCINPAFIEALLLTADSQAAIDRMKTGGSDSGLNLTHDRFRELPVVIAPFGEQNRIVDNIESYLSRLDAAVASLERVQAKLKAYRASVLKAAVEGRLVPTEADLARGEKCDSEPAQSLLKRILAERRRRWEEAELAKLKRAAKSRKDDTWKRKYQEPVAPDTTGTPELPKGWCWASVDQLGVIASGQTPKGVAETCSADGAIPWFRVGDMNTSGNEKYMIHGKDFLTKEQAEHLGLHVRPAGTIIFPKRGGAIATNKKRLLNRPSAYDLNTMGVVPAPEAADYLWVWFLRLDLGRLSDGSNVPQINHGDMAPLAVPLPPGPEQKRIIDTVEQLLSSADTSAKQVGLDIRRCGRLRQAILKWAFEGKLADEDPTDDPAEKLLERIRAERAASTPTKKPRDRKAKAA